MFKLVVFDLDGTLVDSRQDLAQATNRLILEYGGQPLDQDAVVHMVGEGAGRLVGRAFAAAGLPVPEGALERFLELYGERLLVHTRVYPGVAGALAVLSRMASLAVLTNKPRVLSVRVLQGLGLAQFFGQVLGGDGPHARKPDPEGVVQLMEYFEVGAAETLLVGDSAIDLRTARAAGVAVALVRYGFGFCDILPEELHGDELLAGQPSDLPGLLQGPTP
jgi:phosphoglycolate phosphatase